MYFRFDIRRGVARRSQFLLQRHARKREITIMLKLQIIFLHLLIRTYFLIARYNLHPLGGAIANSINVETAELLDLAIFRNPRTPTCSQDFEDNLMVYPIPNWIFYYSSKTLGRPKVEERCRITQRPANALDYRSGRDDMLF